MSDFKFIIHGEFHKPDFSLGGGGDNLAYEIAEKVHFDCKRNIRQQTNVDGSPFAPLAKKTLRNKRAKKSKYVTKALMDTGKMIDAIEFKKTSIGKFLIGVNPVGKPRRDSIALINHKDGVNQKTRIIRQFMGVSEKTQEWIDRRLIRFIKQQFLKTQKTVKKVTK